MIKIISSFTKNTNQLLFSVSHFILFNAILSISTAQAGECTAPKAKLEVTLENAFPELSGIEAPIAMTQPKRDSSFWFIVTRKGQVLSFDNKKNAKQARKVLDIRDRVDTRLEMGFTSAVFHPQYPKDKRLFFVYNDKRHNGRSTAASIEINPETRVADIKSEKNLLTLVQQQPNHNGGNIIFGPDNMLYLAFGDGGYDMSSSQNLKNLHGSILRIDVSKEPYIVPADNPFNKGQKKCVRGEASHICPEIFAYGLRNPWRFSFDKDTDQLWLADVGEDTYEEINRINAGKNYGWYTMEGNICSNNKPCDKNKFVLPITQYGYDGPQSIVGGYVYRGKKSPALQGHYIFTDTFSSILYTLNANTKELTSPNNLFKTGRKAVSFAQGNDGEIYLLNFEAERGDTIHSLVGHCTKR